MKIKNNILVKNSFFMFLLQGANYLIPLIIIPYLTRTLGKEGYGKIAFSQSYVMLVSIFIDYGFSLSATREIAKNRDDKAKLNRIVSLTIYSKLLLLLVTSLLVLPVYNFIPIFKENIMLFTVSFLMLGAMSLNTDWYFLGIEHLKYSSFSNILGKVILISLTLIFIKINSSEYVYLIFFALSIFISNSINLFMVKRRVDFIIVPIVDIFNYLKKSVSLFFFKFTVSFYTSANSFIVGMILSPAQVGVYAGGEKITKAFVGLFMPLSNVIYPRINYLLNKDFNKAKTFMKKVVLFYGIIALILSLVVFFASEKIAVLILGKDFIDSATVIKILSPIILMIALSNVTGILWLLPLKKDKQFNIIIVSAGILNLLIGIPFTYLFGVNGMATAVLISEVFVTLSCFYLISKINKVSLNV